MSIPAYPLAWPQGWRRSSSRKDARFSATNGGYANRLLTVADGVARVREELRAMKVDEDATVISTNVPLRLDGFPRSNQPEPDDCGAAVYWDDKSGRRRCMAIDRYNRVADNLAAIAATLNAMRAIERHGGAEILDRAFTGFAALTNESDQHWSDILGVPRTAARHEIEQAYRRLRSQHHPDRGGDPAMFQRVQRAFEDATCAP